MALTPATIAATAANIGTIAADIVQEAMEEANKLHSKIGGIILLLVAMALGMWLLNIYGMLAANLFFFFGGLFALTMLFISPRSVLIFVGVGVLARTYSVSRKDITEGALQGLKWLYHTLLAILAYHCMIAGFLSVWSFADSPISFFYLAAFIALVTIVSAYYGEKTGPWVYRIVLIFSLFVIVYSLWQTVKPSVMRVANEWGLVEKFTPGSAASSSDVVTAPDGPVGRWATIDIPAKASLSVPASGGAKVIGCLVYDDAAARGFGQFRSGEYALKHLQSTGAVIITPHPQVRAYYERTGKKVQIKYIRTRGQEGC